ncbi:AI-2E family transporter [soil metagenome]
MIEKTLSKTNTILLFTFLVIIGLYYGSGFFIPLTFAIFFSMLIVPVSNFIENKWGAGRITSSLISTLILFLVIGLVIYFLFRQLGVFLTDLIDSKDEIRDYISMGQKQLKDSTGFSIYQQEEALRERLGFIFEILQTVISNFLAGLTGMLMSFMLVLIYVLLLLINRDKFVDFLMMYVPEHKKEKANNILSKTQKVAYKYLWGRIQVMLILGVMYTILFFAYDLEHAPLLIIFGVIITIIPYIGPLVSGILPVLFMIIFGGSTSVVISFTILVLIIQLIESYVVEPLIIGSEVHQSPLFVIIAIILGGALWGLAGMILFVPIFGILKIIFDNNKELKPIGFLIGYKRPGSGEDIFEKLKKKFKK